jgi:phage gp36-like protein
VAYCTQSDIEEQIGEEKVLQLTDDDGVGSPKAGVITKAITDADNKIDSYVGKRFTIPLNPVPDLVKSLSVAIAAYHLRGRRRGEDKAITKRYEDAIEQLKAIQAGTADFGEETEPAGGGQGVQVSHTKSDRTFSIGKSSDGSVGSLDNY